MTFCLPEKVTIWNKSSNDGFGGSTWTAPLVVDARIALKREKITDENGDDYMSKAVFYCGEITLTAKSKVLLGISSLLAPPEDADDVRAITQTPSGAGDLKKAWL